MNTFGWNNDTFDLREKRSPLRIKLHENSKKLTTITNIATFVMPYK